METVKPNEKDMKNEVLMACVALAAGAGAQSVPMEQVELEPLPMDTTIRYGQLENGLTYYVRHNENPQKRAYFYLAQKVGSVQEEEEERGLAHLLEHMCFNGSEHFEGNGIIEFCRKIGVSFGRDLNAYTSIDRTVYNVNNVPTDDEENLDSCLYILYDWAHGLSLTTEEIDKERGVVHEEWRLNSNGMMRIFERQLPTLMPGSRYGNRLPIGLMSVIDSCDPNVLRSFYKRWYRPDLQSVIVVGDIDADRMVERIKAVFGSIEGPEDAKELVYYAVPDNEKPIIVSDKDKEISQPTMAVMLKHDALPRECRATAMAVPMSLISSAATRMMGYRFSEMMENPEAPFVYAGVDDGEFLLTRSVEALSFYVVPKQGRNEEAAAALLREIVRLGKYGFSQEEYERFKLDMESSIDRGLLSRKTVESGTLVQECVGHFIDNEACPDYEYKAGLYRQMLSTLPLETVNTYAQETVGGMERNVVILAAYPEKEEYPLPTVEELGNWLETAKNDSVEPYVAKPVDTKLLEEEPTPGSVTETIEEDTLGYKGMVLSNGVRVMYKQTDFEEANIKMTAISKGGTAMLRQEDMDNAMVFNRVMDGNGLGRFSSNELQRAVTGKQVSIGIALGEYSESVTGSAAPKDLATLLRLVYLQFTDLNNDTLNYETTMQAIRQSISGRDANPMTPLKDSLLIGQYDNNPRFQPERLERLDNVSYEGLRRIYWERFGNAADFTFVFTGNIDEDSLRHYATLYLASIPTTAEREQFKDDGVRLWKGMRTSTVKSRMETPMAYLVEMWHGTVEGTIADRTTAMVLSSLLTMEYLRTVREEYSFAYTINTAVDVREVPQTELLLITQAPFKPEKTDSVLKLVDDGLKRMSEEGPTEEQLAKVKEQILKDYDVQLRRNSFWEGLETAHILYGTDRFTGLRESIAALSTDQVRKFAKKVVIGSKNRYDFILQPEEYEPDEE